MVFAFECICSDDTKPGGKEVTPEDYTDQEIIDEAEYRLSTYFEEGHINNDMRVDEEGVGNDVAVKDIRMLIAFLKKFKTAEGRWSNLTNHLLK